MYPHCASLFNLCIRIVLLCLCFLSGLCFFFFVYPVCASLLMLSIRIVLFCLIWVYALCFSVYVVCPDCAVYVFYPDCASFFLSIRFVLLCLCYLSALCFFILFQRIGNLPFYCKCWRLSLAIKYCCYQVLGKAGWLTFYIILIRSNFLSIGRDHKEIIWLADNSNTPLVKLVLLNL